LYALVENTGKSANITDNFEVIKFSLSQFRISFLSYPDFFQNPHPVLQSSVTVDLATGKIKRYDYSLSVNPPILHRKETLLGPNHPLIPKFQTLSKAEEAEGLFENAKIIGFKKNWERLLAAKGLSYKGHKLIKKKTRKDVRPCNDIEVERHKTAVTRYNFSRPIQTVLEYDLLTPGVTFFDYGCGRADDVRALQEMGLDATGWDPIHRPDEQKSAADIVNLGFVLNVIEDQIERISVLQDAHSLSRKLLLVSCMISTSGTRTEGRPYKDGILTNRGTFQKYFYQGELHQYIEDALETTAVAVGPGIFYVFRDPVDQQEFLSKRNKRTINWEELSHKLYPSRAERRKLRREELYQKHKDILESMWAKMLDLGRLPKEGEFDGYEELRKNVGTTNTARKIFIERFGEKTLNEAFQVRTNDLLVYMALSNFKKRVPFKHLSNRLQTDIKTFIGSYTRAINESKNLLFSIGKPDVIKSLCANTPFGFFDHKAMYIHKNLIEELHPVLRIYIGCAGILYGDLQNVDIIKIHGRSGKVTLLKYDDFDKKPLPELVERVKVDLRKQRIDVFDHQSGTNLQLLYFKENYVSRDHPERPKWEKFSSKLRKLGFEDSIVIGPTKQEFLSMIEEKGLTINLNKRRRKGKLQVVGGRTKLSSKYAKHSKRA
jgi:DNA phosphorothioation-associated putative methyltransferase